MSSAVPAAGSDTGSDARLAADLVERAGALARRMRGEGLVAEQKTSVSDLVTAADRAAEQLVLTGLEQARPADGVVGEEGAARTGTSGRTWVIDPVDGTYNFVAGLTWWCSALALEVGGRPVLGAVHHPAEGATYLGGDGLPATRNGDPLAPLDDRALADSCLVTYLHPALFDTPVAAAYGRFARRAATVRMLGSGTLDAMAIARGQLHVLCQQSVPAWDRLPGEAIITAAGGASRTVSAAGRDWYVAGVPTAVAEVCAALTGE